MATTPLTPIISAFDVTTTWQDAYTVPADTTSVGIDAVVFNNYSANNATFSVRILQSGTTGILNEVITDKDIRALSNDLAPAIIGQSLIRGGILQVKASANNSINLNVTATVVK